MEIQLLEESSSFCVWGDNFYVIFKFLAVWLAVSLCNQYNQPTFIEPDSFKTIFSNLALNQFNHIPYQFTFW